VTAFDKPHALASLHESRRDTLAVIAELNLDAIAHPTTGWRVRDVLGHVAVWEIEATRALEAYRRGESYPVVSIPDFNEQAYRARQDLPLDGVLAEWQSTREAFIAALEAIPAEDYERVYRFPWGGRESIGEMAVEMAWHEREHVDEIQRAIS
jgi:uncharacterized protein (TIGR03083 family)